MPKNRAISHKTVVVVDIKITVRIQGSGQRVATIATTEPLTAG